MKYCKRFCIYAALLIVMCGTWIEVSFAQDASTWMPDANLRAEVLATLQAVDSSITQITQTNIATLTALEANGGVTNKISNLKGLEHATSLTELRLSDNQISDISPLKGLTSLTSLALNNNQISDISPLKGLTSLTSLEGLSHNQISDISPLSSLTELIYLELENNQINDISPLKGLTKLRSLYLENNQIYSTDANIAALKSLTALEWLALVASPLNDLPALEGARSGDETALRALLIDPPPPPPTGLTATPGDRQVTLSWTAPSGSITGYEYRQDDGTWTSTGSFSTTYTVTNLTNGIAYTFKVRGVNSSGNGAASTSVTVTPLRDAPRDPVNLQVEMVPDEDKKTARAILTWNPPSNARNAEGETLGYEYRYKSNPWTPWTSTGSSETTHTVTGLQIGTEYTFQIRAFYVREGGDPHYIYTSPPSTSSNSVSIVFTPPSQKSSRFECPVGWVRSDGFAGSTRRALLYEIKLEVDLHNRVSIYKPTSVAIYVHPDEGLETLEGWTLQVAVPYNHHKAYLLTAENSVVVASKIEGVAGGFAFIENPEATPFPMARIGFTGAFVPGFDYRLYDDKGRRVDFGLACYKRSDIFQVLQDIEEPSVLRKVDLETLDWDVPYIRSEWTVPVPVDVPGAPSLQGVNLVGKWADLKKQ